MMCERMAALEVKRMHRMCSQLNKSLLMAHCSQEYYSYRKPYIKFLGCCQPPIQTLLMGFCRLTDKSDAIQGSGLVLYLQSEYPLHCAADIVHKNLISDKSDKSAYAIVAIVYH